MEEAEKLQSKLRDIEAERSQVFQRAESAEDAEDKRILQNKELLLLEKEVILRKELLLLREKLTGEFLLELECMLRAPELERMLLFEKKYPATKETTCVP